MEYIIQFFVFIPVLIFIAGLFIPETKESAISFSVIFAVGINFLLLFLLSIYWIFHGYPPLAYNELVLFSTSGYVFNISFYFDRVSLVYLFTGTVLTLLVARYSRYYLHRETGYKRFFNTILFFYSGYTITVLSGNFETLFTGWEILGISSFLLIAFYRNRYLPVKNGIKVFSIYRIGDIGILLAMWMSHHLWNENISFIRLNNYELVHEHIQSHSAIGIFISLCILVAASAKSAQLPFSSWLPRAMEGPTPSSAIFYGSLSVHIGVFLLLRTYNFWEHQYVVRVIIALTGLATAIVTTLIARVQSSVKSQIAYSSAAQIGIIFIEIACGFELLALIHFTGNAFLRTYQLLVSPSLVSYLIREQFYHFEPRVPTLLPAWRQKLNNTFYILSIKEFNLDWLMYRYVWGLLKRTGKLIRYLRFRQVLLVYGVLLSASLYLLFNQQFIPGVIHHYTPVILAGTGLLLVLKSFAERQDVYLAWTLIIMNHCFIVMAILFNEHFDLSHALLYMSGVVISGITGFICLSKLRRKERTFGLNRFYGFATKYKTTAFVFLLACLGLSGFPITPTFIGEDLVFTHIHQNQLLLAFLISVSLIVDGITLIRIYSRIFLGEYIHEEGAKPYRSS